MRDMQSWLDSYSADHRNHTNQMLHWICVPAIVWSVVALLWTIPVPERFFKAGTWAVAVMVAAFYWYWQRSHRLAAALLLVFAVLGLVTHLLFLQFGATGLREIAVAVFVLAWIGQFVGHQLEGRRPSFLTDLSYLLIGPAWLMAKLLRKLGFDPIP